MIEAAQQERADSAIARLRVLVLDEEFPFPPNSGKRIRTWNLLRRLAVSHEVRLICFGQLGQIEREAAERAGIEVLWLGPLAPDRGLTLLMRLSKNLFSVFPYSVQKHTRKDFQQALAKQVDEFAPSLIHCEWGPYAVYLEPHRRVPSVVVAHNVESVIWARRAALAGNPVSRWFFGLQARRMERFERTHLKRANQVIAVSDVDANVFHGWGISALTVDNGVELDQYQSAPVSERADSILFLASLDWFPNIDALNFFIKEIYPLIRKEAAGTKLRVVGRRLSETDASTFRQTPGVEVIGEVSDVRDELQRAGVVVVPLRIGGGSRLKILEAFAAGKAVVSTTVGAEGLDVKDREHLRIADNPADFSRAVLELLADPAVGQRLGSQARALVEQKYGWDSLSRRMEDAWLTVSGGRL